MRERTAPDGRLTYPPVQGEPDCLRCGLLRRFGSKPDDILLDHLNNHGSKAPAGDDAREGA